MSQYQLKNAIKSGGTVFCIHHLGLNSLPGSCVESLGPNRSGLSIFSFFGKPVVVPTIIPVIAVANMLIDIPAIMFNE